jgi:hypothetical protein
MRPLDKKNCYQEGKEGHEGDRHPKTDSFKPSKNRGEIWGEKSIPVRETEKDTDGTKIGID